jgi:dipeptidyl aminopeptidase/acylaminoacyl peptidase
MKLQLALLAPVLALVALVMAGAPAAAKGLTIDDMIAMRRVGDPAVSPDGKQVAFSVRDSAEPVPLLPRRASLGGQAAEHPAAARGSPRLDRPLDQALTGSPTRQETAMPAFMRRLSRAR